MNICLCKMTKSLMRQFFQAFVNDPDVFADMDQFYTYTYNEENADAYWERQQSLGRIHLAVMLDKSVIGEIILKNIDLKQQCCTLSIHLVNDSVKNHGYGTEAELQALQYAFERLKLKTVFADALVKNRRSRHVLQKVGFKKIGCDGEFIYYRYDQDIWHSRFNY